ncbi:class I SAM-dependent methyltransferase [Hahella aquimaris]|uniref:class I SAM-dependent methyltransferase n=1 Tax=Hahella sp. HNIBRBA332 TaxID=3015983 RepID=UPI00273B52A0|nr:class I SAM-dependent methyltransferase [Hahella sp. HNIBRBA332]WLQ15181.1 class I SAM-dependent methyltransferase [Hahella sp. HNIBRBA332]
MKNVDAKVVEDFGNEWGAYPQDEVAQCSLEKAFNQYFDIFPFNLLDKNAAGFDMGCGSGRWASFVAPRVGSLTCIDPSEKALGVARKKLSRYSNVSYECAPVDGVSIEPGSQDFGYCLGVLHHIPDTESGIKSCSELLKSGAPFLLYLYYNFENRGVAFKLLWRVSDVIRKFISSLPFAAKKPLSTCIAALVYFPFARAALCFEKLGFEVERMPLSDYRGKEFYYMKTDALDRFGTRLEKRFSREDITKMLERNGFRDVKFSPNMPYWVCLAFRK